VAARQTRVDPDGGELGLFAFAFVKRERAAANHFCRETALDL
jgi:hypothetical protein